MNKKILTYSWKITIILILFITIDYFKYPYTFQINGGNFNKGENGLWLRYTWYFGKKSKNEIKSMARNLTKYHIKYAYFHVRSIKSDGTLKYRYANSAKQLVTLLHDTAPSVKAIAWIYAGNKKGKGEVDLTKAKVRKTMVKEALWLINDCGFDGIQWDYEVCPNEDPYFIKLLHQTKSSLPSNKILSVAVPIWYPKLLNKTLIGWSEEYFTKVAKYCNQIVVMCYDSGFWLPRGYVWIVCQQAIRVTRSISEASPQCKVLFGIPTYYKGSVSHNPHAENIRFGIKGVREGLSNSEANLSVFSGISIFADYTTQQSEWDTYNKLWIRNKRH